MPVAMRLLVTGLACALLCASRAAAPASAPAPGPGPAAKVTRLITLGTQGGPRPSAERAQAANVLLVNGTPYLVDAGNGVLRQLVLAHVPYTAIHQIFITHNHDDHNADWGTLMGVAWSTGNYQPITVYGPKGTESMREGFLRYFAPNTAARYYAGAQNVPPEKVFLAHDIQGPGLVYKDANIAVTAAENCHFHFPRGTPGYGWQQSFSFKFQTPDRVIVFSGDTGACGDAIVNLARGADILVHETIDLPAIEQRLRANSGAAYAAPGQLDALLKHMREEHSTPEEVGRVASLAGVKKVVLTHIVPGTSLDPDSFYIKGVKSRYPGPVVVAHDLMEF
jgi:ribonuclease BN (tRNA processing enzyme)